ncbi:MAG: flagellar biosynthesis protein FlhF [Burkholderiales bacterium]|nr:flagellar biosynthesis protein FlhF [Burkholderiales bacterium]
MNIQRFTAATSREALAKARMAFGDGTLILSNRPTEHGVEVVATAEDTLVSLSNGGQSPSAKPAASPQRAAQPSFKEVASQVEEDADQLAMSTLSFQDYVRERMARKRHDAAQQEAPVTQQAPVRTVAEPVRKTTTVLDIPTRKAAPVPERKAAPVVPQSIVNELHAMKDLIEDRFNTLTWLGQARQNPVQANMMLKMIRAGYSPTLARAILERMPEDTDAKSALRWVMDVLARNLHTDEGTPALHDEGGVFALVGATGVGKTTTAAKLAGLCASVHGPGSVGLITLDTYRIGAHEQLRAYGKILGVVAHLAHDKAALQDLLGLLSNKKMVLIDTTGIAPRDPRKRELMDLLDLPEIKRLLVLNAGGHGDTLDDAISCFKIGGAQHTLLSKTDEAVKLGPAIDAAIRHQLVLRGVTTGQRVPEDWEPAIATNLVRQSMRSVNTSAFDPTINDLGFFFSQPADRNMARGHLDA